jgi:hypothetical protein
MTAWDDYCAAARRLDAIRRGVATAAGAQAQAVHAARDELTAVQARLVPQQSRLRESGVPDSELWPTPADAAAADQAVAGGPRHVLAALRQARASADSADAALLIREGPPRLGGGVRRTAAMRNLLVYGPFGAVVLVVEIVLYLAAGGQARSAYALGCGFVMPVVAFLLGWVGVGIAFPAAPGTKVDRTPAFGAVVCLAPAVLAGVIIGILWIAT